MSVPRPLPLMFACVLESMTVGLEMIISEDDVPFGVDRFEETECERSFLESENIERIRMTRGPRLPRFFSSGA